jgi:hypothetical protein
MLVDMALLSVSGSMWVMINDASELWHSLFHGIFCVASIAILRTQEQVTSLHCFLVYDL